MNRRHCYLIASRKEREIVEMDLNLTFDRFVERMKWNKETVLKELEGHQNRGPAKWRITAASAQVKKEFYRFFGVELKEVKENIDNRSWKRNITELCKGRDVNFAASGSSPTKRSRKSLNSSLNESFLENFDQSTTVDEVDELTRLQAENAMLREKLMSCQSLFVKQRVATPNSRNGGGSVLKYSAKTRALSISLLSQGETAVGVHRMLKTMVLITPELLEGGENVGIPCPMTLSRWREAIPGLNSLQSASFIENSEKFVLG